MAQRPMEERKRETFNEGLARQTGQAAVLYGQRGRGGGMWDGEGTGCLTVVAESKLREKQREERGIGGRKETQRRQVTKDK